MQLCPTLVKRSGRARVAAYDWAHPLRSVCRVMYQYDAHVAPVRLLAPKMSLYETKMSLYEKRRQWICGIPQE